MVLKYFQNFVKSKLAQGFLNLLTFMIGAQVYKTIWGIFYHIDYVTYVMDDGLNFDPVTNEASRVLRFLIFKK